MLDIQFLRKNTKEAKDLLNRRGFHFDIKKFSLLEEQRKKIQIDLEAIKAKRNILSKEIGLKKNKGEVFDDLLSQVSVIGFKIEELLSSLDETQQKQQKWLASIPNFPHHSTPTGDNETNNVEIRRVGELPKFNFTIRDHVDLGEKLGLDFSSGVKLSGARFCLLSGQMAQLSRGLANFMLDIHTKKHGYLEVNTPLIVNADILFGTGQLPKFADEMFQVQCKGEKENKYLISTAEITLTNIFRQKILDISSFPLLLTAHTPCFRSEAGSYGRDTRGLIRQHQFEKVELVQIVEPEKSYQSLEILLNHAETILKTLELPYRVVTLCTGDLGFSSAKTYDLEVWFPAQNCYREISSCSNMEAFQTRRMQTRFKNQQGQIKYPHSLNASGLAIGRTIAAIIENFQNIDGSITIPKALRPYLSDKTKLIPS